MNDRLDALLAVLRDPERRPIAVLGTVAVVIGVLAALLVAVSGDGDGADDNVAAGRTTTSAAGDAADDATTTSTAVTATSVAPPASTAAPPTNAPRPTTTRRPGTTSPPAAAVPSLKLTQIASLSQPLAMAVRAGDDALYIAEKGGRVRAIRGGAVDGTPVLDIGGQVSNGSEQGLLGLAFSPDGERLYVNYTDTVGDTQVVEYAFAGGRASGSPRRLLSVRQPFANHNGGHLAFGPDGMLYIGLGDGGSGGDPFGNGQNLDTLLGKILRIDPRPSGGDPYTIPSDNPDLGGRREIWSYGLRNPWRFSFDRGTGEIWIADVGQGNWEEINRGPGRGRGANYGWAQREGAHPYNGGARPPGNVDPVHEYDHSGGNCSVTGGFVYRGGRMPGMHGAYLFGDYCAGRIRALVPGGNGLRDVSTSLQVAQLSSFGEDHAGEVYAMSLAGRVYRIDPA